jgi:ABC-type taurine transport system substrate-binding protein
MSTILCIVTDKRGNSAALIEDTVDGRTGWAIGSSDDDDGEEVAVSFVRDDAQALLAFLEEATQILKVRLGGH